jgi:hypothetical protein
MIDYKLMYETLLKWMAEKSGFDEERIHKAMLAAMEETK